MPQRGSVGWMLPQVRRRHATANIGGAGMVHRKAALRQPPDQLTGAIGECGAPGGGQWRTGRAQTCSRPEQQPAIDQGIDIARRGRIGQPEQARSGAGPDHWIARPIGPAVSKAVPLKNVREESSPMLDFSNRVAKG